MGVDESIPTDPPDLSVAMVREGPRTVVSVAGDLDIASVASVRHLLDRAVATGADPLVLDLCDVTFMDSTGVVMIVQAQKRAASSGARFLLRGVTAQPRRVLQIVGVADTLTVEP